MRIATQTFFNNALASIEQQRSQVSQLTQELASGRQVNQPSDNPAAFASAQRLQAHAQALDQLSTDNANLSNQLGLGSQTLNQVLTVIDSVRSIALQAANGTTNSSDRAALAQQVSSLKTQLLGLANTRSPNGAYLFAGSRSNSAPFVQQPSGQVAYLGDGASQQIHATPNRTVSTLLSGDVFSAVPQGNGYGYVTAASGNSGSAVAVLSGVTSQAAATAFRNGTAPYTITFANGASGLQYIVTQAGSTIATGNFSDGMTITAGGINLRFDGAPAAGDQFVLQPSRPQSVFASLEQLVSTLNQPQDSAAQRAQNGQQIDAVLSNLDQSQTRILSLQAAVGVATRAINTANNTNATQKTSDQQALSTAVDANIPQVLTALNEHKLALTSAMSAFGTLSKLSLFNYI